MDGGGFMVVFRIVIPVWSSSSEFVAFFNMKGSYLGRYSINVHMF